MSVHTVRVELPPQPLWEDFDRGNMMDSHRFIDATAAWERVCQALIRTAATVLRESDAPRCTECGEPSQVDPQTGAVLLSHSDPLTRHAFAAKEAGEC